VVAGFFPLLFWPGVMGDFMFFLPATVSVTLLASLFVGMVVNPAIGSLWMPMPKRRVDVQGKVKRGLVLRGYAAVLRTALRWRFVTTMFFLAILVSITAIFLAGARVQFMPETEPREAYIDVDCPQGTNLETSDSFVRVVESRIASERDNLEFVVSNLGSRGVSTFGGVHGGAASTHQNRVTLKFPKLEECKVFPSVVVSRMRALIGEVSGAEVRLKKEEMGPPTGPPVNIEISGDDFAVLAQLAQDIKRAIKDVPNLVDLRDDYDKGKPEVQVNVDRERATLAGLNTQAVGLAVRAAINGIKAGEYREGDKEYDVTVRFPKSFRENVANLASMNLVNVMGNPIPFSAVAALDHGGGLGSINHIDRKRTITVSGEVEGRYASEVLADVQKVLKDFALPAGYAISYTGEHQDRQEAQDFLSKAFIVGLLLITRVMVAEFNSLFQPLIIMTTVILSLSGTFLALVMFNMPFGIIMTGLAVIGLAGIVTNNGIVLLDFINQVRRTGMSLNEAIVEASITRFRPVMLTAVTTAVGLFPIAMGVTFDFRRLKWIIGGESAQWWGPLAIAFIVGLMFATFLTLLVVPTLYSLVENLKNLFRKPAEAPGVDAEAVAAK
jgi:multidrug efflux pump subunit AcrB